MASFFPLADALFVNWLTVFCNWATLNQVALGLTVQMVADLNAAHTAFLADWDAYGPAQAAAEAATAAKNTSKAALIELIRTINTLVHANSAVTPAMLEAGGLKVYDETPTLVGPDRVMQETPPVLEARCNAPKTAVIAWSRTEVGTDSTALPAGIQGIAIHVAVKAADGTLGPYQWIGIDSNSPYYHNVGNAATVTNVYRGQWYDKAKRYGPFGDPVEVAVTA